MRRVCSDATTAPGELLTRGKPKKSQAGSVKPVTGDASLPLELGARR
jgi:hypothetical protein